MEQIRWISTPKCADCVPQKSFARRYACIGCEKLRPAARTKPRIETKSERKMSRKERDRKILRLREENCSLGVISRKLKIPRSTVASVVSRNAARLERGKVTVSRSSTDG